MVSYTTPSPSRERKMRITTMEGSDRVFMNPSDYDLLLDCAPSRRGHLAMRFMGESSCRVSEVAGDIYPDGFRKSTHPDVDIWFCAIVGKDTKDRDTEGKRRDIWVPEDVKKESDQFIKDQHRSDNTPIFPVTEKTLRGDINKAAENAALRTGNEDYKKITTHDFRRFFATHRLLRQGVRVETVMVLGGWDDRESMKPYLNATFDDMIQTHLAEAGVLDMDTDAIVSDIECLRQQIEALTEAFKNAGISVVDKGDNKNAQLQEFGQS